MPHLNENFEAISNWQERIINWQIIIIPIDFLIG